MTRLQNLEDSVSTDFVSRLQKTQSSGFWSSVPLSRDGGSSATKNSEEEVGDSNLGLRQLDGSRLVRRDLSGFVLEQRELS